MEQETKKKDDRVVEGEIEKDEFGVPQPPSWLMNLTKTKLWSVIPDKQVDISNTQPDFAGLVNKLVGKAKHDINIAQNRGEGSSSGGTGRHENFNFSQAVSDLLVKSRAAASSSTEDTAKHKSPIKLKVPVEPEFIVDEFGAVDCEYFDDEAEEDETQDDEHNDENWNAENQDYNNYEGDNDNDYANEQDFDNTINYDEQPAHYPHNQFQPDEGRYPPGHAQFGRGNGPNFGQRFPGPRPDLSHPGDNFGRNRGASGSRFGGENFGPGFRDGPHENFGPGFRDGPGPGFMEGPNFGEGFREGPGPGFRDGTGFRGPAFDDGPGFREGPGFHDGPGFREGPGFHERTYGDGPNFDNPGCGEGPEFGENFGFNDGPRFGGRPGPPHGNGNFRPGFKEEPGFRPRIPGLLSLNCGPSFPTPNRFGRPKLSDITRGGPLSRYPPPPPPPNLPRKPIVKGGPAGYPLVTPKFIIPGPPKKKTKRYPTPPPAPNKKKKKKRWGNASDTDSSSVTPNTESGTTDTETVVPLEDREMVPPPDIMSLQMREPPPKPEPEPMEPIHLLPEPVLIDYSVHPGQEKLDGWLRLKAMELRPAEGPQPMSGKLSVQDARSLLLDGYNFLEALEKLQELEPDGSEAQQLKEKLEGIVVFLGDEAVGDLAKRLNNRRRKRNNRRTREREEKQITKEKREALHAKIDAERQAEQDRLLAIEREHQMRKNADKILSEVKKKLTSCTKALNVLTNLKKLREIRKKDAETKGFQVPDECNAKFESRLKDTLEMLGRQYKRYASEEQTLQVMLDVENAEKRQKVRAAFVERENNRRLKQRKRLLQSLFGDEYSGTAEDPFYPFYMYYTHADRDTNTFIQIRRDWDVYLVPDGSPHGSTIPPGWVQPAPPSNDWWASALTES